MNPDEIWRIRATSTSDEPPDAIVIDYGLERVYVKESLASVVEKVGGVRPLKKFTLPAGGPVYIVLAKVTGVTRAIPQAASPECPCDHRLARRPDPGSGNARSYQRSAGEIGTLQIPGQHNDRALGGSARSLTHILPFTSSAQTASTPARPTILLGFVSDKLRGERAKAQCR